MEDVKVRPLESADRVKLWQFVDCCGERTRELFLPVTWFYTREGVDWFMDLPYPRFVAENGSSEIVGLAYYVSKGEVASLGICVCDQWQRRGIGNIFLARLEEDAEARGFKSIVTDGGTHREGMLRGLLEKRGYVEVGMSPPNNSQVMYEKTL